MRGVGLARTLSGYTDPVVATYATSQLGGLLCAHDRDAGMGLFGQISLGSEVVFAYLWALTSGSAAVRETANSTIQ